MKDDQIIRLSIKTEWNSQNSNSILRLNGNSDSSQEPKKSSAQSTKFSVYKNVACKTLQ